MPNIQYRERTSTGWQTQESVTDAADGQEAPAVALDAGNNIHVIWSGYGWGVNRSSLNVQYRKRTTAWQTQEAVTDSPSSQWNASLAVDSAGSLHVVWNGVGWAPNPGGISIVYRKRTTAWQTTETVTLQPSGESPSISVDRSDAVHVVWSSLSGEAINIVHAQRGVSSWTSDLVTGLSESQQYPSTLWALHPTVVGVKPNVLSTGYAFVWTAMEGGVLKVKHYWSANRGRMGLRPDRSLGLAGWIRPRTLSVSCGTRREMTTIRVIFLPARSLRFSTRRIRTVLGVRRARRWSLRPAP